MTKQLFINYNNNRIFWVNDRRYIVSEPKRVDSAALTWRMPQPKVSTQSNKVTVTAVGRLASPAKADMDRAATAKLSPKNSENENPLNNSIKVIAQKQLDSTPKRGSTGKKALIETNPTKSIQDHFTIKGKGIDESVAKIAAQVLQGRVTRTNVTELERHKIIVRTRESNKYPGLKKISLVYKEKHIAQGSFGKIYKSYNLKHGTTVTKLGHGNAVENNKEMAFDQNIIERIRSKANNKNLKKLLSDCFVFGKFNKGNQELGQEMPFAQSDLEKAFTQSDDKKKVNFLKQILNAGKVLHDLGFIHRDIKPANILLVDGVAKLSDFGLTISEDDIGKNWVGPTDGTRFYLAPEVVNKSQPGKPQDCFAFGLIALEDVLGMRISDDAKNHLDEIKKMRNRLIELNIENPHPLYQVIIGLLHPDVVSSDPVKNPNDKRMTLAEASKILADMKPEDVDQFMATHSLNLREILFKERMDEIGQMTEDEAQESLKAPGYENIHLVRYDNVVKQFFIVDRHGETSLTEEQEEILIKEGLEGLENHFGESLATVAEVIKWKEEEIRKQRIQEIGIVKPRELAKNMKGIQKNDMLLFFDQNLNAFRIGIKQKGVRTLSPEENEILLKKGLTGLEEHIGEFIKTAAGENKRREQEIREIRQERIQEIGIMKPTLALRLIVKKDFNVDDGLLFYNEVTDKFCLYKQGRGGAKPLSPEDHKILLEKGLEGLKEHRNDVNNIILASEYPQA